MQQDYLPTSTYFYSTYSTYFYSTYVYLLYLDRHVARSSDETQLFAQESPETSAKRGGFP